MAPNPLNALVNSVAGSLSLSIICHLSATYMSGPDKCNLVPQEGFEPPTPSLRMTCSTS